MDGREIYADNEEEGEERNEIDQQSGGPHLTGGEYHGQTPSSFHPLELNIFVKVGEVFRPLRFGPALRNARL